MRIRAFPRIFSQYLAAIWPILFFAGGCDRNPGVVRETSEMSFEDVAGQLAAEEAAARESKEAVR